MATKGKPAKRKAPGKKVVRTKAKEQDVRTVARRIIKKNRAAYDELASLD